MNSKPLHVLEAALHELEAPLHELNTTLHELTKKALESHPFKALFNNAANSLKAKNHIHSTHPTPQSVPKSTNLAFRYSCYMFA